MDKQVVVINSWFRRRQIPFASVVACDSVPYSGWFNMFIENRFMWAVTIKDLEGKWSPIPITLASRKSSLNQAREISKAAITLR